jgi:hypothetical protein
MCSTIGKSLVSTKTKPTANLDNSVYVCVRVRARCLGISRSLSLCCNCASLHHQELYATVFTPPYIMTTRS